MFAPNVEVLWPDAETEEIGTKIKYMVALPDFDRLALGTTKSYPITAIEERHVKETPNRVTGSYSTAVRNRSIDIGYYELTDDPKEFMSDGYERCWGAAQTAFSNDTHMEPEALGLDMYPKLLPYFKAAIKSAITHWQGKYRLRLASDISEIEQPELMDQLPDLIVRMHSGVADLNERTVGIQRAIMMFWLAKYKASAECARMASVTRNFTPREARKLIKEMADDVRANGGRHTSSYVKVRLMPTVKAAWNPMRVSVVQEPYRVGCSVKSVEYTSEGSKPTRLQYEESDWQPGWGGGWRDCNQRLDWLIRRLTAHCDYNASMLEIKNAKDLEK